MRPLEVFERPHCACCGQLVTWRTVNEEIKGKKLNFCGDQCVQVFQSYLLPNYGGNLLSRLDKSCFA
jgi:hypothetical protein